MNLHFILAIVYTIAIFLLYLRYCRKNEEAWKQTYNRLAQDHQKAIDYITRQNEELAKLRKETAPAAGTGRGAHTVVTLEVPAVLFGRIKDRFEKAGYGPAIDEANKLIDMSGIGIVPDPEPNEIDQHHEMLAAVDEITQVPGWSIEFVGENGEGTGPDNHVVSVHGEWRPGEWIWRAFTGPSRHDCLVVAREEARAALGLPAS